VKVRISIPYNLVEVSGRVFGLDAFFWIRLSLLYRRVLLIRDAIDLNRDPHGCKLDPEVNVEDQIKSLIEIANTTVLPNKSEEGIPISVLRLSSLIIPYRVAEKAWEPKVNAMVLDEVGIARAIAKGLLDLGPLKPLNTVRWLNLETRGGVVEDRVMSYLSKVDKTFSISLLNVIKTCSSPSPSLK
jgi:hypothetical protein